MSFVYILQSQKNGKYYIGSCSDLGKRLAQHNAGYTKSTKPFIPWIMMYWEKLSSQSEARKREYQLKSWKKRVAIEKLIKDKGR